MDEFTNRWVTAFYLKGLIKSDPDEFRRALAAVEPVVVERLLETVNWRSRMVGSWFAGLKGWDQFEEQIGAFLLTSELTYAGSGYCFALACFGSAASRNHLRNYLDQYLPQLECRFDQPWALAALLWLDDQTGSQEAAEYLGEGGAWDRFTAGRKDLLPWCVDEFRKQMDHCRLSFGTQMPPFR